MIIDFYTYNLKKRLAEEVERAESAETALKIDSFAGANYDASACRMDFYNGYGDVIDSIDATDFIIDGMIEDVTLSGSILTITFNTDAGQQDIVIDLTDFINPENYYTTAQTDTLIESASTILSEAIQAEEQRALSAETAISGEVETLVNNVVNTLAERVDDIEEVTSIALNELHNDVLDLSANSYNYLTSADTADFVNSGQVKTQIEAYEYVNSAETKTQIEGYEYVNSGDVETIINNKHYITSGDADTQISSAIAAETARTEQTYLKEHQSLSAYSTTEQMNTAISNAIGAESARCESTYAKPADIPSVSDFVTSADVQTQVENYHYVNSGEVETQILSKDYITIDDIQPDIIYQAEGSDPGFYAINNSGFTTWQKENLNLSPYKFIRFYVKAADLPFNSSDNYTSAEYVDVILEEQSISSQAPAYVGVKSVICAGNRNRSYHLIGAVDLTKTKLSLIYETTLWDITISAANNNGRYCYKIEGYRYNVSGAGESGGGGEQYYAGDNISISSSNVISVTGIYAPATPIAPKFWSGTQAQYDALGTYDNNTIYFIQ